MQDIKLGGPGLVHHPQLGQLVEQRRICSVADDVDREVIDSPHFLDALNVGLVVGGLFHRPLDREHDIIGGEGCAVVESHFVAQFETYGIGIDLLP